MKNELIKISDYQVLIEEGFVKETKLQSPNEIIGIVYYLSGEVLINIERDNKVLSFKKQKGMMSSFYNHQDNIVNQYQNPNSELKKVSIFLSRKKLETLIEKEQILKTNQKLKNVINPQEYFVSGFTGNIDPLTQMALEQIINNKFTGIPKELFLEGQTIGLIANFLHSVNKENNKTDRIRPNADKLHHAKEILLEQMDSPPNLKELAKLTGLNTYKLKTGFKELFGMPVFKFLQGKRLEKAFELIENKNMTIQEAAWYVGYESIGSFTNAFKEKFGIRPSDINK